MRRLLPVLIVLVLVAGGGYLLAENPGRASLDWHGWRVDTSGAALAMLCLGLSVVLAAVWRAIGWLANAPARGMRSRDEARRRKLFDTVTRGYLALAAGKAEDADVLARQATALDPSPLAYLLAGHAAEARGDDAAAQGAYAHLLNDPESKPAGQRALRRLALRRGGDDAAETGKTA